MLPQESEAPFMMLQEVFPIMLFRSALNDKTHAQIYAAAVTLVRIRSQNYYSLTEWGRLATETQEVLKWYQLFPSIIRICIHCLYLWEL